MAKFQAPEASIGSCDIYVVKLRNINSHAVSEAIRTIHSLNTAQAPTAPALPDQTSRRSRVAHSAPPPAAIEDPALFVDSTTAEAEIDYTAPEADSVDAASRKPKKFPTPKAVPDLNFSDGVSLVSIVEAKKPSTDWDKYVVIAMWFKEHRQMSSITPDHVYTAYRFLGANGINWGIPKDMGQVFRDSKKKKSYWDNGEKKNWWNVNHIGEARFNQLPQSTD